MGKEPDGVYEKRWMIFRIRPGDLLTLLQLMGRQDVDLHAEPLPPDIKIADAFYDPEQEQCALVLESAFYSPVQARLFRGRWSGGWDELIFALEDDASPPVRPTYLEGDVRWEAYFIPPERIVQLMQTISSGESYHLPPLPPDTRLMDAFFDPERKAFVLFLESSFFELSDVAGEGSNLQVGMPERYLNLTRGESNS